MGPGIADLFMRPYNFKARSWAAAECQLGWVCCLGGTCGLRWLGTWEALQQGKHRLPAAVRRGAAWRGCLPGWGAVLGHPGRRCSSRPCSALRTPSCHPSPSPPPPQVWAVPTTQMQCDWLGERVATVDVDR